MTAPQLFEEPIRPLSVVHGRDSDVIPLLLTIHAKCEPRILDACHNAGVMWKGSGFAPTTTMDSDASWSCDETADFRDMPFGADTFDVVAFDPPHLPAAIASPGSSGIEARQYGLTTHGDYRQGDDIADCFDPFLREAQRVLVTGGIVIAKLADFVHNHRYQWSHVDFVLAARAVGMTPCDVIIKIDPTSSNLKSSKWKSVRHFRRAHTYWIVVRNSSRCEGGGAS